MGKKKKRKDKSKSTNGGQLDGPLVKQTFRYGPKAATSSPKKEATNEGDASKSSSMLKTAGLPSSTEINPRSLAHTITSRSGLNYKPPTNPLVNNEDSNDSQDKHKNDGAEDRNEVKEPKEALLKDQLDSFLFEPIKDCQPSKEINLCEDEFEIAIDKEKLGNSLDSSTTPRLFSDLEDLEPDDFKNPTLYAASTAYKEKKF
ncbi:hypothetical protein Tco_1025505 [Tanacetum coccineum]